MFIQLQQAVLTGGQSGQGPEALRAAVDFMFGIGATLGLVIFKQDPVVLNYQQGKAVVLDGVGGGSFEAGG